MKKLLNYSLLVSLLLVIASCENGFDELNTSKTGAAEIDPVYILNNGIVNVSSSGGAGGGSSLIYDVGVVQHIISPNSGVLTGANYNQDNRQATQSLWQGYYRNVIRYTADVIHATQDDATRSNLYQMARILQTYALMVLTDAYGDIPYFEAGKGYLEGITLPQYDAQEDIYPAIIQDLKSAVAGLSASGKIETADVLYGGDVAKWTKFANSLILRAGMRLSTVDPTLAAQTVASVEGAELILTNADNAVVRHDNNYQNALGVTLNGTEGANFYLTAPFVDHLKNTNDPRLTSIAVRYKGAKSGPEQANTANGNPPATVTLTKAPADQIGMPMGHDNSTIGAVATGLGLASFYDFSQVDRKRMAKLTAPMYLVSAAQTHLLLAEATERGWISTGQTAAEHFEAGIRAHMEQLAAFDAGSAVPPADINTYVSANPYDAANYLEQINTQYWIASFLNGPEAFANYRRSGFPALAPNPYPGKEVTNIYRLTYPTSEISVNSANVNVAIDRMGGDKLDTRVWWDNE
ncbi:SusD/RagB family nutrient-binding outer membrane lipoprotein [Chryseolinea sp. H1M3-3]|uniref:SusD/RagB family nutrient-binding outer membrane lipoprotein n=1 Tax=Chryseolinea sp. H1M3-3 TaxID=3034144 RepID=UPI0023EE07C3|nr:SusD/RagB family nutrient-binding outer membrane lipoprotein [Chryseolinea sp. H1M3-3]